MTSVNNSAWREAVANHNRGGEIISTMKLAAPRRRSGNGDKRGRRGAGKNAQTMSMTCLKISSPELPGHKF